MQFKNFLDLNEVEKVLVYGWRNHLKIAPFMRTQTISLRGHLAFLETLRGDESKQYFLLIEGGEILGVVCFVDINFGISCEFGIYQNPDLRGNGTRLMEAMLEYAKSVLRVSKIYACVLNCNTKAIALYAKFGFILTKKDATMSYFKLSTLEIPTPARGGGIISL
ncbi:UDP-4-amino-4,6-dideoxy-N-acetyl-beta-L-altrosamine N-acetyltransferase [Helicobacter sp. MIT 05-5294]|uniref:UDP-4-amino-4, 6-dideoxy-N-acetyl-beta-L-altrosamine N-acetyltransferase n=1 Tax=Helicobacter sp. MIT 05-5294 TaxID=1548150 RepID=UPI001EE96F8D|nr:UDP-4-amino-4,6-dideoxy-N-acetyl-beta-L-altrosamine N-acetyltransferase [Helicobacter sp. MIT 05-5294]